MRRRGERILLYPRKLLAVGALTLGLALAFEQLAFYMAGGERAVAARVTRGPVRPPLAVPVLCFFAAACGISRAHANDPLADSAYRGWLATAPWRPPQPLALGPVQLVARDLIVLLPLGFLGYAIAGSPLLPLRWFLCAYVAWLGLTLTGKGWWRFSLLLGFAVAVRLLEHPLALSGWIVLLYVIAILGLQDSLRRLPFPDGPETKPVDRNLGWPFDALAPRVEKPGMTSTHAALYALLAGAWVYSLTFRIPRSEFQWPLWALAVGGVAAFIRLAVYWSAVSPALPLRERLAHGRWLRFTNNRMYVAPALTLFATALLPPALASTSLPPAVSAACCAAVLLFLAMAPGPTLANWRLTAHGRLSFNAADGRSKYVQST